MRSGFAISRRPSLLARRESPAPPPSETPLPTFVSAAAREFSLTLSRPLVGAGNVEGHEAKGMSVTLRVQ